MADPLTLAAGLGAAGIGYSMYRYGVRPTLRGLGYGALGATAFGAGYASQNYDEHDVALLKDVLGVGTDRRVSDLRELRDRFSPMSTTRTNEHDTRFSGGRVRERRSTAVPAFVSGRQNNMPGGFTTSSARPGSQFMGQHNFYRFMNETAARDLQSAAEHVFGQDRDNDEYPAPNDEYPAPFDINFYN
jgi:hypothetical protein